ncbi:MAG: enoyl-CoA hydratase/isomerase family protein [Dehalococcoidales bacterium]|nr:enoyl-CoA hydratase/isomerase family protein [Dehalococcoidales bacterium]
MSDFETIIYEKLDNIARVTLNRPKALNAYSIQMRDDLYEVLGAIRDDPEVRVIILKGAGEKAFCAGADLTEFLSAPPPVLARRARFERDIWGRFLSIPKPFIAAMHGYVLGSGIEMSLCCDLRLCSDDAQFGLPEVTLGIIPAAGGSQTLPRTIGRAPALDILLTGRWLKADEARRVKLVNKVLPRRDLLAETERLANLLKNFDTGAVTIAKLAVTRGLEMSLEAGLHLEKRLASWLSSQAN